MPEIPIEIVNLNANAGFKEGIINGNIEGSIKAGITVSADICHGINLGIDGEITGDILGNLDVLFIGAQAKGEVQAAAGARALIRVEPNLLEKMGLSIYVGAYARAMASGSLAVYLTPEFFAQQIQDHLDDFSADIFLIFLEEVKAEVGVWGRIAFSAMAEANFNIVCDIKKLSAGFEISGGYKYGLKAGAGYDFYCHAGFKNLRRAVNRSSIRTSAEIKKYILKSDLSNKVVLAECFDFTFPFLVLTSYDLGHKSAERGEFLNAEDVSGIFFSNFLANLQRYAVDKITEAAVYQLTKEFSKIYYKIFSIQLSDAEKQDLETSVHHVIDTLKKGDLRLSDLNVFITEALNIADILDQGATDHLKRPLTVFWASSIIGFELRELLSTYSADLGLGSTLLGEAVTSIQYSNLPDAPQFVKEQIGSVLGETIIKVDVRRSVDYLIEIGIPYANDHIFREIESFRNYFENTFSLTFGQIFEDVLRGLQGEGSLGSYHSYQSVKEMVKTQFMDQLIMNELLPQITNDIDNEYLYRYAQEVIRPSVYLVSDFTFNKLDDFLIRDLSGIPDLPQFMNGISSGCGAVVYNVLARNMAFFDQIVNDFILDSTYAGFDHMGIRLSNPQDPFFVHCKNLISQSFSHIEHVDHHIDAVRQLLLDLTYAFKEISGPTIFTGERRNNLRILKRDILLSMTGSIDYSQSPDAVIEKLLDCAFIPNKELVGAFGNLMLEINVEAFGVFTKKIIPSLSDFYLAIGLPALTQVREDLLLFINELYLAAQAALDAYNALSDYIDLNIIALLDAIDAVVTNFGNLLNAHLETWGNSVKASIHFEQVNGIKATIPEGSARDTAILTFENTTWPVQSTILDIAISAGTTALKTGIDKIVTSVDSSTDVAEEMIILKQSVEDVIADSLIGFILKPINDAANLLVNTLLPESLFIQIEEYLQARKDQKELEREKLDQEQELELLRQNKEVSERNYDRNNFNPLVDLIVFDPLEGFPFIYPKEVSLVMKLQNGNFDMISNPSSKRIQVTLNSVPIDLSPGDWSKSGDGMLLKTGITAVDDGLNILEVSWIKGPAPEETIRYTIPLVVDINAEYKRANFDIHIESNPPGLDVDGEHVSISYHGTKDLKIRGWKMVDNVGHKYYLPSFTFRPEDNMKIYTGGSEDQNKIADSEKNKLLYMGRKKAVWNNEGDSMYLSDYKEVLVCKFTYLPD